MKLFDINECIILEGFYNKFVKSKGDDQYRIVVLGFWTVDMKNRFKFITEDPDDTNNQHMVIRG